MHYLGNPSILPLFSNFLEDKLHIFAHSFQQLALLHRYWNRAHYSSSVAECHHVPLRVLRLCAARDNADTL